MSKRERFLAVALSGLAPLALSFAAIYWFIQKYGDNNLQIISLASQVSEEENKTLLASKAMKRLDFYQHASLPSDLRQSAAQYQLWLLNLARRHQLKGFEVKPQQGQFIKFKNKEIGKTQVLRFEAEGGLDQATAFLYEFYSLNTLHRVKSIRLAPKTTMANGKKVRTGEMGINLDIELAVLNQGNDDFDFQSAKLELPKPVNDYQQVIMNRNIFGPPNNSPIVTVRPSASYASGSELKITVRGEDGDKDDQLDFSLVAAGIEGAKLEPREGSRDATLILPPAPAGSYTFKVAVKDSGFPAKQSETEFDVVLKDPPNKKPSVVAKLSNPYPPERPLEIVLEGSDGDNKDLLEFAIVEGIEGAEIVKADESDRNPILMIPAQEVGTYPFTVSVSDGREGADDKLVEKSFEIQVVRKFSHLNETKITSIVREKTGEWFVNVRVRTTGQRFSLTEGDSFEVERKKFTVEKIEPQQAVFVSGDQRLTLEPGNAFTAPKQTETFSNTEQAVPPTEDAVSKN